MTTYYDNRGHPVVLDKSLGKGAEGQIWTVEGAKILCVKILAEDKRTPEKLAKLHAMTQNQPQGLGRKRTAWPKTLIYEDIQLQRVVGFAMRYLDSAKFKPLDTTWTQASPDATTYSWGIQLQFAIQLARIVEDIHAAGHAVGDLQRRNVLVSDDCEVFLVDCDSFEIREPDGRVHAAEMGSEGYVPHEVLIALENQIPYSQLQRNLSDRFALAVLIFELLMGGEHPMSGRGPGVRAQHRSRDAKVKAGLYAYGGRTDVMPRAGAQPLATLPESIVNHFYGTFVGGYAAPESRPTAAEWRVCLEDIRLARCIRNQVHSYASTLPGCPWCHWDDKRVRAAQARALAVPPKRPTPAPPQEPAPVNPPQVAARNASGAERVVLLALFFIIMFGIIVLADKKGC